MENEFKELSLVDLIVIQDVQSSTAELFYKPIEAESLVADKAVPYLGKYPQELLNKWANNQNILIYENEEQLRNFIRNAKNNINDKSKMYFGRISSDLAKKIKNETKSDIEVEGYNLAIAADVSYASHNKKDIRILTMYSSKKSRPPA